MTRHPAPVIYWIRRDLRISDNVALSAAAHDGRPVIPLYFASQWRGQHHWTGAKRQEFLCECLASLANNLAALGGRLIVRHGSASAGIRRLIKESGAQVLHFQKDPDPFGKQTEAEIARICRELGVECHGHDEVVLHHPDQVLTQSGQPYRVYTPYSRNWLELPKTAPIGKPKPFQTPPDLVSEDLPTLAHWRLKPSGATMLEAGEKAARKRLKQALDGIVQRYGEQRDIPSVRGTSRLSQDLRFGLLSIRTIHHAAVQARQSASPAGRQGIDKFIKELAWREFYFAILHHYPEVLDLEFNPDWRGLPWLEPGEHFERWKTGTTGFPIVDAGMRELLATGYMHNRVRMITAMFLTKDLHIDWRLGESFFLQHLIDGEIASNNGGWQWSAGTGADAAPYFRIQNPWSQTARYDPKGLYIKQWIPELKQVDPARFLEAPKDGKPIAPDYPLPCVDHHTERERTLAIFKRHKEQGR